jgi:type I restriction enzyme, S subunit
MSRRELVRLGDVATIVRKTIAPERISDGTTYVGLENIERGGALLNITSVSCGDLASTKFEFTADQVLFGKLRPYLAKIARPAFSGVCSTDILPITPGPRLDKNYLAQYLVTPDVVAIAASRATGANLPRLSPGELAKFEIPLPPLDVQQRIAAILDQADALRAKRREALAHLDDLTQSIFLDMFGGDSSVWPTEPIAKACNLVVDCVNRTAPIVEGPTPYKMIRTSNVKSGQVDLSSVRYVEEDVFLRWNRRATPRPGDVLLTREAPVGQSGILDTDEQVFLGQRLMLYRVNPEKLTPEYLLASFNGQFLQAQFDKAGSGSTVKHLPLPVCRSFEVVLPPVELQQEFTTSIHELQSLKNRHREQLTDLNALFASLQSRAFVGEL